MMWQGGGRRSLEPDTDPSEGGATPLRRLIAGPIAGRHLVAILIVVKLICLLKSSSSSVHAHARVVCPLRTDNLMSLAGSNEELAPHSYSLGTLTEDAWPPFLAPYPLTYTLLADFIVDFFFTSRKIFFLFGRLSSQVWRTFPSKGSRPKISALYQASSPYLLYPLGVIRRIQRARIYL